MDDPAVRGRGLKMYEPPISGWRVHERALVRTVDGSVALRKNHFVFIRAEHVPRPKNNLPAGRDAARGSRNVVPAISLMKLGTFQSGMTLRIVEYNLSFAQKP